MPAAGRSSLERAAAFLDRDGTINRDSGYFHDASRLEFEPNAAEGIRKMNGLGFVVVVVTNQPGIGRGIFSASDMDNVNRKIKSEMKKRGAVISGFYHCAHRPEDGCGCRKPGIGLFEEAAKKIGIDIGRSWVVGDKTSDIMAAESLRKAGYYGVRSIGLRTGHCLKDGKFPAKPDFMADDLLAAAEIMATFP
jgi:histidinol-phosphate phosphatase family protein